MNEQIKAKLENKEFVTKVLECKDEKEVKELFAKDGINITDEEIQVLGAQINVLADELKKLPENELEAISGGRRNAVDKVMDTIKILPRKVSDYMEDKKIVSHDTSVDIYNVAYLGEVAAISIGTYVIVSKTMGVVKNWWNSL